MKTMKKFEHKIKAKYYMKIAYETGELLTRHNKTLAIAESCTGGLIANIITNIEGSSNYFLFSAITYSNYAKTNILNVKKKTIKRHGAVSLRVAIEMAKKTKQKAGADFGLSTTGIAGLSGGTTKKPVGMVCIGFATDSLCIAKTYKFNFNNRVKHKMIFSVTALELLYDHLVSL